MHPVNRVLRRYGLRLVRVGRGDVSATERARFLQELRAQHGSAIDIVDTSTPLRLEVSADELCCFAAAAARLWLVWVCLAGNSSGESAEKFGHRQRCHVGDGYRCDICRSDDGRYPGPSRASAFSVSLYSRQPFGTTVRQPRVRHDHFSAGIAPCWLTYGQPLDLDAPEKAPGEVWRALRPGGRAVFVTYVKQGRGMLPLGRGRIFGIDELKSLVKIAGFAVLDMRFVEGDRFAWIDGDRITADPPIAERGRPHHYSDQVFITAEKLQ